MEFNIEPYYDDFEQNAKDNNYLKILFQPSRSVQARELNQIQSILQNQIKSFGDHIFQDGSPVIGGNLTLDSQITYIKLEETYANEDIDPEDFVGKIILRDPGSLVQAKVLASFYPSGGTPTLMIKYITGVEFSDGDTFKIAGTTTRAKLIASAASGKGTVVSINEGIFYVSGYFVTINPQTAVVSAYSQNANVKVGLEISDDVVDYVVDSTLLDPAQKSFNYQAPGGDRYQFNLNLSTRPLETAVDESQFFELMRVENGVVTKQVKYAIYSELEKTLARRTFDESGDYTVTPFAATVSASSDDNNYIINIEPGKAYVKGFEFETLGSYRFEAEKPRTVGIDTRSLVDIDVDTSYGNYIKVKNFRGNSAINISALETVDLHCVAANSVNIGIGNGANSAFYGNTKIGTARIRDVARDGYSGDINDTTLDGNGLYRLYLTEIDVQPKVIRMNVQSGMSSNTINLTQFASQTENAYQNVTITILPITLTPIANVNTANIFIGSTIVNANSAVSNTFASPNVSPGDIIRVGDETRSVVSINTASNNWLVVNSPFTQTYSGGARLEVLKQANYTSNVTGQSRTIVRYASNVAYLDRPFLDNAVPASNTVVQLNFGIKDLESVIEGNVATPKVNAWANVATQSKLINGDTQLFENSDRAQIFRLPRTYVKYNSLDNIDYVHTKYVDQATGTSGVFTIALEAYESIPWADTNNNVEDNLIAVVRNSTNPATYPNGSILILTAGDVAITTGLGGSVQITTSSVVTELDVYVNVKENDVEDRKRTKTLRSNPNYTLSPSFTYPLSTAVNIEHTVTVRGNTAAKINVANGLIWITDATQTLIGPGDAISLYTPDVIKVRRVLSGNVTNEPDVNNYKDITDNFLIDYGQSDELYEHAKLVLKQGYPAPNSKILIHADFFQHTYPAGASYFGVDSYPETLYNTGEIPVYNSRKFGEFVLRDCLDFRPTREIGKADGSIQMPLLPNPDSTTELSFQYYLPRIDKLVLTKNKEFKLVKGVSAPNPTVPADLADAMTLYTIYLPPYVPTTKDVRIVYNENKRYTMKDISRLDKRLEAVEYYTSLNNVETLAMNDSTQYEDGTEKEKYGIIGEGFRNYNIADYDNPDFTTAILNSSLQPDAVNKIGGLKLVGSSSTKENYKTITLNYTETPAISQNVTSNKIISVQPYMFASFEGSMKLTPEMDFWVSEQLRPEVIRVTTNVIAETTATQVVAGRVTNPTNTITVTTPTTNAGSIITTTPGSNPPAGNPADDSPWELANDVPIIVDTTVNPDVIIPQITFDPVLVLPVSIGGALTTFGTVDGVRATNRFFRE